VVDVHVSKKINLIKTALYNKQFPHTSKILSLNTTEISDLVFNGVFSFSVIACELFLVSKNNQLSL
jgi:hypothetical protein